MVRSIVRHAIGLAASPKRLVSPARGALLVLVAMTLAACTSPTANPPTGTTNPADAYAIEGGSGAGRAVATFDDGSAVVVGRGSGSFGDLSAAGPLFVGKVDPAGSWAWVTSAGTGSSTGTDFLPHAASALSDGGTLVAGQFRGTMPLGSLELVGVTDRPDAFVAKIDADGTWVWATAAGGTDDEVAKGVSAAPDGGAYVAGWFDSDDAAFGSTVVDSSGSYDTFVAKIDAAGAWSWVETPSGDGKAEAIAALPDGGAIVVGYFTGSMTFGDHAVSASSVDAFVAKIDATGTWAWATKVGGSSGQTASGVSALADGGAAVAGHFFDIATFGATTISSDIGGVNAFVAKVAADGTWVWATAAGGEALANEVSALDDGGAIVGGHFKGAASFGGNALASVGGLDAFIAKVDAGGSWVWAVGGGGSENDLMNAVATWSDGSAIGTGVFNGPATFGSTDLVGVGGSTVLVAKVDSDGGW
jgi:hypothetical protein